MELYHGDIIYSENRDKLNIHEDSYIAVENGKVEASIRRSRKNLPASR